MLTWRSCVSGGETPINNSVILLEQLKAKHPEFIEELEKKVRTGVLVTRTSEVTDHSRRA